VTPLAPFIVTAWKRASPFKNFPIVLLRRKKFIQFQVWINMMMSKYWQFSILN